MYQVRIRETNIGEPLLKRREVVNNIKTWESSAFRDKHSGDLKCWLCGVRRSGGVNLIQASERNVRTYAQILSETPKVWIHCRAKVARLRIGAEQFVVVSKQGNACGAKGLHHPALLLNQLLVSGRSS